MWARTQVGIGYSYRPARLHRLAELIPGLLKRLKTRALLSIRRCFKLTNRIHELLEIEQREKDGMRDLKCLALHIFTNVSWLPKARVKYVRFMGDLEQQLPSTWPIRDNVGGGGGGRGGGIRREAERTGGMIWSEFWHEGRENRR
jgi:hypothetical protein